MQRNMTAHRKYMQEYRDGWKILGCTQANYFVPEAAAPVVRAIAAKMTGEHLLHVVESGDLNKQYVMANRKRPPMPSAGMVNLLLDAVRLKKIARLTKRANELEEINREFHSLAHQCELGEGSEHELAYMWSKTYALAWFISGEYNCLKHEANV